MAREYVEKLSGLVSELNLEADIAAPVQTKHFFGGAALYVNGRICASWSPVGLAFRLTEAEVADLIGSGRAKPLRYFPEGHVKKGYAVFGSPDLSRPERWREYLLRAARLV